MVQLSWVSLINGMEYGLECGMEWWNGMVEWNDIKCYLYHAMTLKCSDMHVSARKLF